jgi:hypothetical protein
MRSLVKVVAALAAVAVLASPVMAQRGGPRGFGPRGGGVESFLRLLQNKSVQEELKIEKSDVDKVPDALMEALGKALKKDQLKRLKEIELQQRGSRAFYDAKIQKALKITEDQKKELDTIQKDAAKEMRELFQGGNFREAREKMVKLNKETTKKVMAVLKADQKKAWKAMIGEPFEIKYERPMGGGRRGRREN